MEGKASFENLQSGNRLCWFVEASLIEDLLNLTCFVEALLRLCWIPPHRNALSSRFFPFRVSSGCDLRLTYPNAWLWVCLSMEGKREIWGFTIGRMMLRCLLGWLVVSLRLHSLKLSCFVEALLRLCWVPSSQKCSIRFFPFRVPSCCDLRLSYPNACCLVGWPVVLLG